MRPPRLLRAVLAAFVLAGTVAGPVSAAPGDPLLLSGPPDGARVAAGAPVPLHARGGAGDVGLELRVSISPQAGGGCRGGGGGRRGADVARAPGTPVAADASLFAFATAPWYARAGTYFWQVSRTGAD